MIKKPKIRYKNKLPNLPSFSIIIPTFNSERFLKACLKNILKQNYPKKLIEIIVVDNKSTDKTKQITSSLHCRYLKLDQPPPQVCRQRNLGTKIAKGDYLLFLDHDMILQTNFFKSIADEILHNPLVGAWYIPEKILAHDSLLTKVRNFENECAKNTVISAARLIKKKFFSSGRVKYDISLSSGPADWDMDIQLKLAGVKLKTLDTYLTHNEKNLTMIKYIRKKAQYINGICIYRNKWMKLNKKAYISIVSKQLDPFYRGVIMFFEDGKWKQTVKNFPIYLLIIFIALMKGFQYYLIKSSYE